MNFYFYAELSIYARVVSLVAMTQESYLLSYSIILGAATKWLWR